MVRWVVEGPFWKTGTNWSLGGCPVSHDTSALAVVISGVTVECSGGFHTQSDIGLSSCLEPLVCMRRGFNLKLLGLKSGFIYSLLSICLERWAGDIRGTDVPPVRGLCTAALIAEWRGVCTERTEGRVDIRVKTNRPGGTHTFLAGEILCVWGGVDRDLYVRKEKIFNRLHCMSVKCLIPKQWRRHMIYRSIEIHVFGTPAIDL